MQKDFYILNKFCGAVTKYSIYALVFFLPVFFLPWTTDAVDFNKQALLVLLTCLAMFAFMAKVLISGKFSFRFSKIQIAVLVLFLVFLLSTIFSWDKYGSFWGWPRVTSESFLSFACLSLLYFLISSTFSRKEIFVSTVILALSSLLAAFFWILQFFGVKPLFNTMGSVGSLGIFVATLLPLLIILEIYGKKWLRIIMALCLILAAGLFVIVNYSAVWWVVLAVSALTIIFAAIKREVFDLRWMGLPIFFLALALFFLVLRPQIPYFARTVEISLNQVASFEIALKTLKEAPIFGTGPGTFIFDFLKHKSADFNKTILWNTGFDGAGSKVLTILATTGILGFISFLALLVFILFYGIGFLLNDAPRKGEEPDNYILAVSGAVFLGFIGLALGFFLYNSNLSLNFLFFYLIACFTGLAGNSKKEHFLSPSSFSTLAITFIFTLLFIFGLGLLILEGQRYAAEVNYFSGVSKFQAGDRQAGLLKLEKAVSLNPKSDLYLVQLSQAYLSKMADLASDKELSQEEKNESLQLFINNSINAAKMATDLSPKNAVNWSARAFVYQSLIGAVPTADDWAIKMYDEAINLEPVNPYFPTQKGIIYYQKGDYNSAESSFKAAINVFPDYSNALYFMGLTYYKLGQKDKALTEIQKVSSLNPDNEQIKKVVSNLQAGFDPLAGISPKNPPQPPVKEK